MNENPTRQDGPATSHGQAWPLSIRLEVLPGEGVIEKFERAATYGFDVVELLPMPGHHASDFLAAKLVYRVLAEIWAGSD